MALFKNKKDKKSETSESKSGKETEKVLPESLRSEKTSPETLTTLQPNLSEVILRPRITEKATDSQEKNSYVFEVFDKANKKSIAKTIERIYKVRPIKINIAKNPSKNVFIRGKKGVKRGVKKAYVYLKAGDRIEIV